MAVEIPWLIPFMTSSHSKPRICSQKMSKAMTVKTGICGDRPKPMTPQPSMTSIKIRIVTASLKLICLFMCLFLS